MREHVPLQEPEAQLLLHVVVVPWPVDVQPLPLNGLGQPRGRQVLATSVQAVLVALPAGTVARAVLGVLVGARTWQDGGRGGQVSHFLGSDDDD